MPLLWVVCHRRPAFDAVYPVASTQLTLGDAVKAPRPTVSNEQRQGMRKSVSLFIRLRRWP